MIKRARRAPNTGAGIGDIPYIDWALTTGRSYYFIPGRQEAGKERMPLLLRLKGDRAQQFLDGTFFKGKERRERWKASFQILCDTRPFKEKNSTVWVGTMATAEVVAAIQAGLAISLIEGVSLGRPLDTRALQHWLSNSMPKVKPSAKRGAMKTLSGTANPQAVVMGIIDDGIAFVHERFRKSGAPSKTRVENWWWQEGSMRNKAGIDALIALYTSPDGILDEDALYRHVGLMNYQHGSHKSVAWRAAHGTHVMDLACGFDPASQVDDRPIVCVQLPTEATADEEPGTLEFYGAFAILYIVLCAQAIAAARGVTSLPIVINWSYGLLSGPHDGKGWMQDFIQDMVDYCKNSGFDLRVVLPSGNSYLSRTHAQASFTFSGQVKELLWRVLPDDRTPSFLEIWLPSPLPTYPSSRLTLKITSPTGTVRTIKEFQATQYFDSLVGQYGRVVWSVPNPSSGRARFTLMAGATAEHVPYPVYNPPLLSPVGTWKIELTHTGGLSAGDIVHAWIWRDDMIYGFPLHGRQSYLHHADYNRLDGAGRDLEVDNSSLVKRVSTINSLATGPSTIVIGGYLGKESVMAKYSAAGAKTPAATPRRPDASTISEDSRVHRGRLAAGSRSGSTVSIGGTSVAAPQVARIVADNLAMLGPGDHAWVQSQPGVMIPQPERRGAVAIPLPPIVKLNRYEWP